MEFLKQTLDWVQSEYNRPCILTALGQGSLILKAANPDILAVTVDTGYLFPETLRFLRDLNDVGIEIEMTHPSESVADYERRHRGSLHHRDPDLCCCQRKVEPLRNWIIHHQIDAVVVGARRDQGGGREQLSVLTPNQGPENTDQIAPLADYNQAQIDARYRNLGLPQHALWAAGYNSVGCWPCTMPGSGRNGRWPYAPKRTECGIIVSKEATVTPRFRVVAPALAGRGSGGMPPTPWV